MRVGIDIGGTKILVALVASDGTVMRAASVPTPRGPSEILAAAATLSAPFVAQTEGAVGVGTAGTVDPRDGSIRYATDAIPGWTGTQVGSALSARLGRQVLVDNDVNAAALGEAWLGSHRDLLLVAVGTGLGAGIVRDGVVQRGSRGAAGEIAHLPTPGAEHLRCGCGRFGHLESIASGTALAAAYPGASGKRVGELAREGDPLAREVIRGAATALGRTLAGLVALLDPEAVVLAGGAAPSLMDTAHQAYTEELLPGWGHVPLVPARLGAHAVAVGAARLAMGDR